MSLKWTKIWDDVHTLMAADLGHGRFFFLECTNMHEACGADGPKWCTCLSEVDITFATARMLRRASEDHDSPPKTDLETADRLYAYGPRMPLAEDSRNNRANSIAAIRKEANRLHTDPNAYRAAMQVRVNAIGSTPEQYFRLCEPAPSLDSTDPEVDRVLQEASDARTSKYSFIAGFSLWCSGARLPARTREYLTEDYLAGYAFARDLEGKQ